MQDAPFVQQVFYIQEHVATMALYDLTMLNSAVSFVQCSAHFYRVAYIQEHLLPRSNHALKSCHNIFDVMLIYYIFFRF
jgi:hypothetical protein